MPKISLDDTSSGYNLSKINENFQKIEDEFNDKVLYRENPVGEANTMSQPLDMNGFPILNCPNLGSGGGGGASDAASVTFVPSGDISSFNVQDALEELDAEKAKLAGSASQSFSALTQAANTNNNTVATTAYYIGQAATALPAPIGLFPAIGTSTRFAREDHVHVDPGGGGGGEVTAINNGQLYAYQRSATILLSSPGDVTYDFTVGKITAPAGNALANGWTKEIPSGTDPLYVCVASAANTTATDNIASAEWTTPVILAANGLQGLNVAILYLYQRAVTPVAPALPTSTSTYDFSTKTLSGFNNGWSTTVPSDVSGRYLYVTTATAASTTSTDTIPNTEWAAAQIFASSGTNGTNGTNGSTGATGATGQRGTVQIAWSVAGSSWSNTEANNALIAGGYYPPINRDIITQYNTGAGFSETRFYDGGSWITLGAYINGNLLVTGTLSANKVTGGTLAGVVIQIGTGHTPGGKAFEVDSGGNVSADNIFGGFIRGDNFYIPSAAGGIYGAGYQAGKAGVFGIGASDGMGGGTGSHGVRGQSVNPGGAVTTSGLVGGYNGYDFYAEGGGSNYGPFTGSHDVLVLPTDESVCGDIMIDVQCISRSNVSNTIFHVERSSSANQSAPIGVLVQRREFTENVVPAAFILDREWIDDELVSSTTPSFVTAVSTYELASVNAIGEGQINVTGMNGDIQAGDYIVTSPIPGKGMKQSDDVQRTYTVARAREACVFDTYDQVKQIACIYLCG